MQIKKFEVDKVTIDFYIAQIQQLCDDLRQDYWTHYQSIHKIVWRNVENVWKYRKGADIDILSDLQYTLDALENAYLNGIESDDLCLDIIVINEDI